MKVTLVGIVNETELNKYGEQNELNPMLLTEVAMTKDTSARPPEYEGLYNLTYWETKIITTERTISYRRDGPIFQDIGI